MNETPQQRPNGGEHGGTQHEDTRHRRAEAAAERARQRALRPWWQRPWPITGSIAAALMVVAAAFIVIAEVAGDDGGTSEMTAEQAAESETGSDFDRWAAGIHVGAVTNCDRLAALNDEASQHAANEGTDTEALAAFRNTVLDRIDEVCTESDPDPTPTPTQELPPPPEPDLAPDVLQIGDGAQLTTNGEVSEVITISDVTYSEQPADQYGSGPDRKVFVIFGIRIDGKASTSVYEDDFYIVTNSGERVDHGDGNSWDAVDMDDMIGYAELNAGQHKEGVLVFDSPVRHGTLAYDPNYEGEPIVAWEF